AVRAGTRPDGFLRLQVDRLPPSVMAVVAFLRMHRPPHAGGQHAALPLTTGLMSLEASSHGMDTIFVEASYEVGIQSRPPLTCGQTSLFKPSPGARRSVLVYAGWSQQRH